MTEEPEERLLTPEEAATWLRCDSVRAIRTERAKGRLGYIMVAGKVRIPMSEIYAYLDRNKVQPCLAQQKLPVSTSARTRRTTSSAGTTEKSRGELARTLEIVKKLRASSKTSPKS